MFMLSMECKKCSNSKYVCSDYVCNNKHYKCKDYGCNFKLGDNQSWQAPYSVKSLALIRDDKHYLLLAI